MERKRVKKESRKKETWFDQGKEEEKGFENNDEKKNHP